MRKVDLNHSEKLKQVENDTAKAKLPNLNNNNVSYNQSKTVNLKPSHQSPDNSDTSLQEEPSDKNNRTAGSQVQHPEKKTDADPSWLSLARNRSEWFKNRSENRLEIYEQTPAPDKNNKLKNEVNTTMLWCFNHANILLLLIPILKAVVTYMSKTSYGFMQAQVVFNLFHFQRSS